MSTCLRLPPALAHSRAIPQGSLEGSFCPCSCPGAGCSTPAQHRAAAHTSWFRWGNCCQLQKVTGLSVHLQVLAGSQCQKDALLGCNFRGEPMVSTAGVTSQAESHQNRRAHPVLATATWGWRLHAQLREHPHHLTRISISMVLQAGNTNVINSLTHIKQKWGSLSISDGSPKAGRVPKAISEAGSALRRTPCQPRAQPPQGNTIPCYCPGKMSIFN